MIKCKYMFPTDKFKYKYLAGPVLTKEELDADFPEGNCRFALQLYFYRIHGLFFGRDEIYLPGGYKVLGEFVFKETDINVNQLKTGDVIYAQNIINKQGDKVDKSLERYKDRDEWLYYLHSVIYLGELSDDSGLKYIWHSTHIDDGPTVWDWNKFLHYYKPISVKRVI